MLKKYSKAEQATDDIAAHADCCLDNWSYKHNSKYVMFIALPLQQTCISTVVTSGFYVWVFRGDTGYDNWVYKHRVSFRSFFDSKSAFCMVMTKQHKIFSNCNWPIKFQWLLYVPRNVELSIALLSVRTIIFACPICFLQERKLIFTLKAINPITLLEMEYFFVRLKLYLLHNSGSF